MDRRIAATLTVTGFAMLVGSPLAWSLARSDAVFGDPPPAAAAQQAPDRPAPASARAVPPPASPGAAAAPEAPGAGAAPASPRAVPGPEPRAEMPKPRPTPVASRPARLADLEVPRAAEPVRLTVPSLGVDAPVTPVGVLPDTGDLEIPTDVRTAGWYRFGAAPGAAEGSAVLSSHVDSRRQGPGALFRLAELAEGAEITVELADGTTARYVATARQRYDKSALPTADLFARDGPHRLVLITCGGAFDQASGRYRDNVVVIAEPAGEVR